MGAVIDYLPIWKINATAEERFLELASVARKHPERFARTVVIFEEVLPVEKGDTNPCTAVRWITSGADNTQALGLLEVGKHHILKFMFRGGEE